MKEFFKRWIRHMVTEGANAGLYDTFLADPNAPELPSDQAAAAFLAHIGSASAATAPSAVTGVSERPQLSAHAQENTVPSPNGTAGPLEQVKRGRGRPPRKFQEPPQ
jgi:hypothetical protein